MYVYKITITYKHGGVKTEWICPDNDETIKSCQNKVDAYISDLEANQDIIHVKVKRRTLPGI